MRNATTITILAGLASAALFLSLALGVVAMPVVAYFVQLPILFVGLTLGLSNAALASAGSAGLVLAFGGWVGGLAYLVVEALPALLVLRQALLSRQGADGSVEWYPPGLLLVRLVLYALAVTFVLLVMLKWQTGDIAGTFASAIDAMMAGLGAGAGGPMLQQRIEGIASLVPGIVAVSWVLMMVINLVLAQALARRSERALRPSPEMASLWLPFWVGPALAVTVLAALTLSGDLAYFAQAAALLLAIPYLFQGLAVVHVLVRKAPARILALAIFYLVLVLFSWPLILVVIGLGLVEDWAHLRRRFA